MSDLNETTVIAEEPPARNPAVLALAVIGALLAGALVWFFVAAPLLEGDAEPTTAPSATAPAEPETTEAPTDGAADGVADGVEAEQAALPIVTYEVFLDRDPFDPVVPEPVAQSTDGSTDGATDGDATDGSSPDGTTDGTATDGTTGGTATDGADGGTAEPAPSGCTSGEDEQLVCDGRVVSLVDLRTDDAGERFAVIQVDTTLYEVRAGETFAGSFRLQSIGENGVYLLYGDDAFGLDEGERVLK